MLYRQGGQVVHRGRRRRPAASRGEGALKDSTTWRSASIRGPSGSRCTTRSGASSATSSTTRTSTASTWPAAEKKYAAVPATGIASRADLNYLFDEMLGELSLGHMYVARRRHARGQARSAAACSARTTRSRTAVTASPASTTARTGTRSLRAPLTQPGVNVKAGEYLLAVNGRDLQRHRQRLPASSRARPASQIVLKVGPNADGTGAREVTVVPVDERDAACATSPGSRTTAARSTS